LATDGGEDKLLQIEPLHVCIIGVVWLKGRCFWQLWKYNNPVTWWTGLL